MKKLTIIAAFLSCGFVSCKKDITQTAVESETPAFENAVIIAAGTLTLASEINVGQVKIYQQKNGKYLLSIEKMNLKAGSKSLVIKLSSSNAVSYSSIKICSVNNVPGNILHELPSNFDLTVFKYLLVLSEPTEEIIASAELN